MKSINITLTGVLRNFFHVPKNGTGLRYAMSLGDIKKYLADRVGIGVNDDDLKKCLKELGFEFTPHRKPYSNIIFKAYIVQSPTDDDLLEKYLFL